MSEIVFNTEDYYPAHVNNVGCVTCVGVHKDLLVKPCYCCGHQEHCLLKVMNKDGMNMINYHCPISEQKSSFSVQEGKLIIDRSVPLIKPGKFVSVYHNDPVAMVKGWVYYMDNGQGNCLSEDDRVWLKELIRRASCLLRAKKPTRGMFDNINGSSIEDEADWVWPGDSRLKVDPRLLHQGRNERISPCGWNDCPEHLNTIVFDNGIKLSGCSFAGKRCLDKPNPFEYAEHYQFNEEIASIAVQRYTLWMAGKLLSEKEKFLLHYHVTNTCREVRDSWTFTSGYRCDDSDADDILGLEMISA